MTATVNPSAAAFVAAAATAPTTTLIAAPASLPAGTGVYDVLTNPPVHSLYRHRQEPGATTTTLWGQARNTAGIQHLWANPSWAARVRGTTSLAVLAPLLVGALTWTISHSLGLGIDASTATAAFLALLALFAWQQMPVITHIQRDDDVVLAVVLALHTQPGHDNLLPCPVIQALGNTTVTGVRPDGTLWRPADTSTQEAVAQLVVDMATTWARHPTADTQRRLLEVAIHLPDTISVATQTRRTLY